MGDKPEPHRHSSVYHLLGDPLIRMVMPAEMSQWTHSNTCMGWSKEARGGPDDADDDATMTIEPGNDLRFRCNFRMIVPNVRNETFLGVPDAWQMPKGGIAPDESPCAAALRELRAEIGTGDVEVLANGKGWLRHERPEDLNGLAVGTAGSRNGSPCGFAATMSMSRPSTRHSPRGAGSKLVHCRA